MDNNLYILSRVSQSYFSTNTHQRSQNTQIAFHEKTCEIDVMQFGIQNKFQYYSKILYLRIIQVIYKHFTTTFQNDRVLFLSFLHTKYRLQIFANIIICKQYDITSCFSKLYQWEIFPIKFFTSI